MVPMLKRLLPLAAAAVGALALAPVALASNGMETAIFGGGCFWTIERDFERIPGVVTVTSGFDGGTTRSPSYEAVAGGKTGHVEAVRVVYDPRKVTYAQLVDHFWHMINPMDDAGQACDRGPEYQAAIFVSSPEQRRIAEESKAALNAGRFQGHVVTRIRDATPFFAASDYHQHFARKYAAEYQKYSAACGRDRILVKIWGSAP